jgi:hypothetical protein
MTSPQDTKIRRTSRRYGARHTRICLIHTSKVTSKQLHITLIYNTSHCAQTFVFKCVQMAAASTSQAGRPRGQEDDRGQTVNKIENNKSKATAPVAQTRHLP